MSSTSFGEYDKSAAAVEEAPLIGGQMHAASCKCDPCKARRKSKRAAGCFSTCQLVLGVATLVALCCLVWFVGDASKALGTLAGAPSPTSAPGTTCPSCTLECPAAPDCSLSCPDVPACPSPSDCPACSVDCPDFPAIPPCPDFPDCDHECPDVHCRECGDCRGGSLTHGVSAKCRPYSRICPTKAHHKHGSKAQWITTWGVALTPPPYDFFAPNTLANGIQDETIRQLVRVSTGGHSFRVRLSSMHDPRFNSGYPWATLDEVSIGIQSSGANVHADSVRTVTFNGGSRSVKLGYNQDVLSDPIELCIEDLTNVAISIYAKDVDAELPFDFSNLKTSYVAKGNHAAHGAFPVERELGQLHVLVSALEVDASLDSRSDSPITIVAFGQSNTQGFQGFTVLPQELDLDASYPDFLADRLAGSGVGVVNKGIPGNSLLASALASNFLGTPALERVARDVYSVAGVTHVILDFIGNDLSNGRSPKEAEDGFTQLIKQIRAARPDILIGSTTSVPSPSPTNEIILANADLLDFVIPTATILGDNGNPDVWNMTLNSGDFVHPTAEGFAIWANAVPLTELGIRGCPEVEARPEQIRQFFPPPPADSAVASSWATLTQQSYEAAATAYAAANRK